MNNEFWINLASRDLKKSREFFEKIGFVMNDKHGGPNMVSMFVGNKNVVVNLFSESTLQGFVANPVTNTAQSTEVLFSIGAGSREEVDAMAEKAVAAGGVLYGKPTEKDGWMYGCGFVDLDGHRWNVLFMDMSKLPKQP